MVEVVLINGSGGKGSKSKAARTDERHKGQMEKESRTQRNQLSGADSIIS